MSQHDDNTTDFFNKLAGKATVDANGKDRGVAMLREALQNQIKTIRQAEAAESETLSVEELAKMAAIKQQLIAKGLIGRTPPRQSQSNWMAKISEYIFGTGWERPVALAASIMFVTALVVMLALPPDTDTDVVRGSDATPVLVVSDPAATIETLTRQLTQAGAEVLPVQINNAEWTLLVSAPRSADHASIKKILEGAGIKVAGELPYTVSIRTKQ